MTRPHTTDTAADRQVILRDSYTPALAGGAYTIDVTHTVADGGTPLGDPFAATQGFEVRAPRFSLTPDAIHSSTPPAGARGSFADLLPHLTLERATLPWEQPLADDGVPGPWLALLVFAPDELPGDPACEGRYATTTVRDLLSNPPVGVLPPAIDPASAAADVLDGSCRYLDVPAEVFTAVVPRRADLPFLAHLRDVVDPAAFRAARMSEELDPGRYAVVVGNRFPTVSGSYAVHLVSLEGFADHLDGSRPAQPTVRMVSLWSWSFQHDAQQTDADSDFATRTAAIAAAGSHDPAALTLRLPPQQAPSPPPRSAAEQEALDRLSMGYVPVAHHTLSGERTHAWYRGPLTPEVPQAITPAPDVISSADQALVYVRESGVFDVSYSSAWTLGQALALANPDTAATLNRIRHELRAAGARLLRPAAPGPGQSASDRFHQLLAEGWGDRLTAALAGPPGPARAAAPPAPRPHPAAPGSPAQADLDALVTPLLAEYAGPLSAATDPVTLLSALPFDALVTDARMLPPESLRFFHVDPAWLQALTDGLLSTGLVTGLDARLQARLRGVLAADRADTPQPQAGFLLRSRLVRDMPALIAEAQDADGTVIPLLLRGNPAPDILFCLLPQVPATVSLAEPQHGLSFGIDPGDAIGLRYLTTGNGHQTGATITGEQLTDISSFLRPGGVLTIAADGSAAALAPALADRLATLGELPSAADYGPVDHALQLLNSPYRITFRHPQGPQR
ncbi:hypothetical protein [Kitasatospora sp. NPDC094016]|uniref:hypothetical protein n=1 Tax=Kitasatospora sp. NPDC094016 TaxID=3154986 RepID=UPI003322E72C